MPDLTEDLNKNIPLSEMIESLRQELAVAVALGEGKSVQFAVDSAELEVEFVAKKSKEAGGGLGFWVVTAEGKAAVAEETKHRFKLNLKPLDSAGKPVKVSHRR